jgi:hypothetical protein
MYKRLMILALMTIVILIGTAASVTSAGSNAKRPAIETGADQLILLQRTDLDWEGTWYWYVGSTYNATNLTGVTALGLLEAFRDVKDPGYLDAAIDAAGFIQEHLGIAPDIIFLHRLSEVTGDDLYAARANQEWDNLASFYPTASDLDSLFRAINRRSAWDMAFFLEAAYLSGDTAWADEAAEILKDTADTFYYGTDTWWYALNLAGTLRALVGWGYYGQYPDEVVELLNYLIALIDDENGVDGYLQDSAYAVMALNTVGGAAHGYANRLGRWLAMQQSEDGGWIESDGLEYPESEGEALRALGSTIGSNVTIDGFEPGLIMNSSWRRSENSKNAEPFNGD